MEPPRTDNPPLARPPESIELSKAWRKVALAGKHLLTRMLPLGGETAEIRIACLPPWPATPPRLHPTTFKGRTRVLVAGVEREPNETDSEQAQPAHRLTWCRT